MMPSSDRRAGADGLGEFALLGLQRRVEQQLRHADHAVHRRADLVTHVGEEVALRAAGGRLGFLRGDARGFGLALLRDVLQRAGEAHGLARVVSLAAAACAEPAQLAGASRQLQQHVVRFARFEVTLQRLLGALLILGPHQVAHGIGLQLVRRVAEHFGQPRREPGAARDS